MFQFLTVAGEAATTEGSSILDGIISYAPLIIVFIAFYFVLIRPQQKKDKADRAMRENLEVGDEIVTAGGIIGRVVSVKDDTVLVETGSDRNKIRIAKWAVSQNNTAAERVAEEKAAAKREKDLDK